MEDRLHQADELLALTSIYGSEVVRQISDDCILIGIPGLAAAPRLDVRVSLPQHYPSSEPPMTELDSVLLDASTIAILSVQLQRMWSPGEVVLYQWVEFLQQEWEERVPKSNCPSEQPLNDVNQGLKNSEDSTLVELSTLSNPQEELVAVMGKLLIHGEASMEKRSTFQAHLAPVTEVAQVQAAMDALLQNNKIRSATHNIMAYRIERRNGPAGTFLQDCDDDGEEAAGGRLLHLLQMVDARNVMVVVSRWFGGVLLGPARFGLINKSARDLLDACGYIKKKKRSSTVSS